jgi:hypothetical protein
MNVTSKMEVALESHWPHPLHSPSFVRMCFTPKHTFAFMGLCTSLLIVNPMLEIQHISWKSEQKMIINTHVIINPYNIH